jgi:hypothetical protein
MYNKMKREQTICIASTLSSGVANVTMNLEFKPSSFKIINASITDTTGTELNIIRCYQLNKNNLCIVSGHVAASPALTYLGSEYSFTTDFQNKIFSFEVLDVSGIHSSTSSLIFMTIQFLE